MSQIIELMGYEYKKILRKKSTWITLGILLLVILFIGVSNLIGDTYREDKFVGTKYQELQKNKEAAQKISGRVIDKDLILEAKEAYDEYLAKGDYEKYRPYRPIIDLFLYASMEDPSVQMSKNHISDEEADSFYMNLKTSIKTIIDQSTYLTEHEKETLKSNSELIETPFIYEYSEGYQKFAYSTIVVGLFLMLGISYCLTPLFSGEYSTKMDALILSTRFGKNKLISAKLLTGLTFSLLVTILGLISSIIPLFCIFGTEGGNMPIQVWGLIGVVMVYPIKCAAGMLLISLCLSFGSVFMSALTMYLSAKLRTPYHAVILSSLIIFLPLIIKVPREYRIINFLYHLFPVNMTSYDKIFSSNLYTISDFSIKPYYFIPVYCTIGIVVLCMLTYRGFKKHQIA